MVSGMGAGIAGGAVVAVVIKAIDQFSGVFKSVNTGMLAAGAAITAVGIAGANAIGGLTKMAAAYETAHVTFATMLGSAEEATKVLKDLSDFAAKTPFTIPGVRQAAKQLVAYGFEVEGLIDNMRLLGDVAGIFNIPMAEMSYLYGTLKAQGRAYTRDMNQFANRGIPIWKEVAKVMGVAEDEIRDLVESGKVGFPEVEQAMKNMTSEGGIAFKGMEKKAATLDGVISNIQDSFTKLGEVMGQVFLPAAKLVAEKLAELMGWFEEHPTIATFAAVVLGVSTALALIAGPILIILALLPSIVAGIGLVTAAWTALDIAMWPVTLTILGIVAGIASFIFLTKVIMKQWEKMGTGAKILVAALFPIHTLVALIVKNWSGLVLFFAKVWNQIVEIFGTSVNWVIDLVNKLINSKIFKKAAEFFGFDDLSIDRIDISGALIDLEKLKKETADMAKPEVVTEAISQNQMAVNAGLKFNPQTGDVYDPNAGVLSRSDFGSSDAFKRAGRGEGITVNIENINGLDPEEISKALSNELNNKVSL